MTRVHVYVQHYLPLILNRVQCLSERLLFVRPHDHLVIEMSRSDHCNVSIFIFCRLPVILFPRGQNQQFYFSFSMSAFVFSNWPNFEDIVTILGDGLCLGVVSRVPHHDPIARKQRWCMIATLHCASALRWGISPWGSAGDLLRCSPGGVLLDPCSEAFTRTEQDLERFVVAHAKMPDGAHRELVGIVPGTIHHAQNTRPTRTPNTVGVGCSV